MFDKNYKIDDLMDFDEKYVFHTYTRRKIRFAFGEGAKLYTPCSKTFIDFSSGIGVNSLGHGNKKLADTLSEQIRDLIHLSNVFLIEPQALLAKKIIELSKYDMRIFFSNSGAEANECAIKMARKFGEKDNRYKIITLKSSFHGRTISTLKATGQESFHTHFGPFPDGFVYADDIDDIYNYIDNQTCGVMIELIQGEGGVLAMPKEKIQELSKNLKEKNILLIIDEVQSGIYRTGELFASKIYGIIPDIITLAKGLGGGVPIGATMSRLKNIFEAGEHGSTFGGNLLSTRAGLVVLEILEEEYNSKRLQNTIELFNQHLEQVCKNFSNLFQEKVGLGMMCGLVAKNKEIQKNLIDKSFEKQLLVLKSGKNTIRFLPPLLISQEEIKEGFERFKQACEEI